ncbi:MAG: molybdenum ABC transporter ATP-binding protein [Gammaproteobacteria bacterium]|nr:molybdenum ABC transporter ATP-binding protein [Gammaproteobacteria bacterium]
MSIAARFHLDWPGFSLNVDLRVPGTGVTALFGPSGSGKTTLLRCVAGLERAPGGFLALGEDIWQDQAHFVPTHRRALGYVFQDAALFPHLSVQGNLEFGLRRIAAGDRRVSLDEAIDLLGIRPLLGRRPDKLSGGERQRVAIARALAVSPRLLLLDEPLAALDLARKREILPYLQQLHETLRIPVLYVTHSPDEVARFADHLVVMEQGRVLASGAVAELMSRLDLPGSQADDAGVVLEATVAGRDAEWHLLRAAVPGGSLWVQDNGLAVGRRLRLRVLARDVSLALTRADDVSFLNLLPGTVTAIAACGHPAARLAQIDVGGTLLLARLTARSVHALDLKPGKPVWAQIKSVAVLE